MSRHLSAVEFVDAAEGGLSAGRLAHLTECAVCAAEVDGLRGLGDAVKASAPVNVPSPLFWDHFSERVSAATSAEPVPTGTGWRQGWRPLVALGAVGATALLLTLQVRPLRMLPGAPDVGGVNPAAESAISEGQPTGASDEPDDALVFVAQVAAQVPFADLQQETRPSSDAADAALDRLSAEQRAELVRLLKARIGGEE